MADLLAQAAAWLGSQRTAYLSRPVVYCRPSTGSGQAAEVMVNATVGRTVFKVEGDTGANASVEMVYVLTGMSAAILANVGHFRYSQPNPTGEPA